MALEMRANCERCQAPLGHEEVAYCCSYECTFCEACTSAMMQRCPNCGGEVVRRPRRLPPAPDQSVCAIGGGAGPSPREISP